MSQEWSREVEMLQWLTRYLSQKYKEAEKQAQNVCHNFLQDNLWYLSGTKLLFILYYHQKKV